MESAYYRAYAELERTHWWFLARNELLLREVRRLLKGVLSPRIVNVGCGTGRTSELLATVGEVHSVEYDPECARYAAETTGLPVVQGDVTQLAAPSEAYDLVCAFDVIEHVENDALAMAELHRVCRSGGFLLLSVPACPFLWSHHDEINHHHRRYTRETFAAVLANAPGDLQRLTYFNTLLFPFVAGFRLLSHLFPPSAKKGQALDFSAGNSGLASGLLERVFLWEDSFLQKRINLPFGVSLLASLQRSC